MTEEKKVTSVADYRTKLSEPITITVPSGALFKVKRLTPIDYIKEGLSDLPNEFFKFIMELQENKVEESSAINEENFKFFEEFLRVTIEKGVVEPLMVLKYDKEKLDTHLVYAELTIDDQKMLVDAITGKLAL